MVKLKCLKCLPCLSFSHSYFRISNIMLPMVLHSNTATLDLLYTGLCWSSDNKLLDILYQLIIILIKNRSIQDLVIQDLFLSCNISYIANLVLPYHVTLWHLYSFVYRAKVINHLLIPLDPLIHFKNFWIIIRLPCLSFTILYAIHIHW